MFGDHDAITVKNIKNGYGVFFGGGTKMFRNEIVQTVAHTVHVLNATELYIFKEKG